MDIKQLLEKYPIGQKRCSSHKQFVFMMGDTVMKGPFPVDRAKKIYDRSYILTDWKASYVLHPTELKIIENKAWIVYPNINKDYPEEFEEYNESWEPHLACKVLRRSKLQKLSDVILTCQWMTTKQAEQLLITFCYLVILGVGDVHLSNVLVDTVKQQFYVIDYDENTTKTDVRDTEVFYFRKDPASEKLAFWLSKVRPSYASVFNHFKHMNISPKLFPFISQVLNALSSLVVVDYSTLHSVINVGPTDMGQMKFKGLFGGSITYSGYSIDVVKSQLQKSIRRGEINLAVNAALELYRFSYLPDNVGKGIVTNLYNRLHVIVAEEILDLLIQV